MRLALVALAFLAAAPARAEDASPVASIYSFLSGVVGASRLVTGSTGPLSDGTTFSSIESSIFYSNVLMGASGLKYRRTFTYKQKNCDIVNGVTTDRCFDKDRIGSYDCQVGLVSSLGGGQLMGVCINDANTMGGAVEGYATVVTLKLAGDRLVESEKSAHPSDCFAPGNTYEPCQFTNVTTFERLAANGFTAKNVYESVRLNPDTLAPGARSTLETTYIIVRP